MKRFIRCLTVLVALCLLLGGAALAAQDITDWIHEYLQTEVSNIGLYEPDSRFSAYGELLYNETTGRTELTMGASEIYAMTAVELAEMPAANEDGEELSVPEGYVLVNVRCDGREDLLACMDETYAEDPAVKRAAAAAAEAEALAALEAANEPEEPEATPAPTPVPTPLPMPEPQKSGLFDFIHELDQRDLTYLIIILAVVFVAILELGLLLVYRRRAENVARNYLRVKSQLDKTKRELGQTKSANMQKDRELIRLRDLLAVGRGEKPAAKPEEEKKDESSEFVYQMPDYADWKF